MINYDDNEDDDDDDDTERQMAPAELVNVTSPAPVDGPTLRADTQ